MRLKNKKLEINKEKDEDTDRVSRFGADIDDEALGPNNAKDISVSNAKETISFSDGCNSLTMSSSTLSFEKLGEKFTSFWLNATGIGYANKNKKGGTANYFG